MTPRLFHMLWDRHREHLMHTELLHAYTTAALVNFSWCPPEKPVAESRFMPNWRNPVEQEEPEGEPVTSEELSDFRGSVANLAALLERYQNTGVADPQLVAMGLVKADG